MFLGAARSFLIWGGKGLLDPLNLGPLFKFRAFIWDLNLGTFGPYFSSLFEDHGPFRALVWAFDRRRSGQSGSAKQLLAYIHPFTVIATFVAF